MCTSLIFNGIPTVSFFRILLHSKHDLTTSQLQYCSPPHSIDQQGLKSALHRTLQNTPSLELSSPQVPIQNITQTFPFLFPTTVEITLEQATLPCPKHCHWRLQDTVYTVTGTRIHSAALTHSPSVLRRERGKNSPSCY